MKLRLRRENKDPFPEISRFVAAEIQRSIDAKTALLNLLSVEIAKVASRIAQRLLDGHCLFLFGNGGSAADAQHIAAEFVGRYQADHTPLPAIALTTDTSALTAIANDFGYDAVFARQLAAVANPGDVALAISTSGRSPNVLRGLETARSKQMLRVALTGDGGGELKPLSDFCLCVPSAITSRIQECHILIGHILAAVTERQIISDRNAPDASIARTAGGAR